MLSIGVVGICILIITVLVSLSSFKNRSLFDSLSFNIAEILARKDYKRLLSSGFIHADFNHLLFNMLSFYFFAGIVESILGSISFLLIYIISLLGGSFLSLWMNKDNPHYRAVGASGAVSGVIFAAIVLDPGMMLGLFFIIPMPGWAFALGFIAYSIFGMKNKRDNIGHDAHLGGALTGMLLAIYFKPKMIFENTLPIAMVAIPSIIYMFLLFMGIDIAKKQNFKIIKPSKNFKPEYYDVEDYYRDKKKKKEEELNMLLDKLSKKGFDSLTEEEKKKLDSLSK
tara:strand:+ start:4160 stop:5008 length:849 start_codon:yes stop_codon:yes gene_type:complete